MNQNLVSIEFSPATLVKLDDAIGVIEEVFASFVQLSAEQVRKLNKMGSMSEHFCRQTLAVLEQNQGILPPDFDLGEVQRDMLAFETLRPRMRRIRDFAAKTYITRFGEPVEKLVPEQHPDPISQEK